jgi:hypothetical protein
MEQTKQEVVGIDAKTEDNAVFINTTNKEAAELFGDVAVRDRIRTEADVENDIFNTKKEITLLESKIESKRANLKSQESFSTDIQPLITAWMNFRQKAQELSKGGPLSFHPEDASEDGKRAPFVLEKLSDKLDELERKVKDEGKAGITEFAKKGRIKELQKNMKELGEQLQILNPLGAAVVTEARKFYGLHRNEVVTDLQRERNRRKDQRYTEPEYTASGGNVFKANNDREAESRKIRADIAVDEKQLSGLQEKLAEAQKLKQEYETQLGATTK